MELTVVRHGETDWNAQRRYQGGSDTELNAEGIRQARELAAELTASGFDRIVSSPLRRAVKTAEIIAEALGMPLAIDDRFRERSVGVYEGLTPQEAQQRYPDQWERLCTRQMFAGPRGGESTFDVALRVAGGINALHEAYADQRVLLVTHAAVSRIIAGLLNRLTDEEYYGYVLKNCAVAVYRLDGIL